jgi:hypothetical protein
MNWKKYCVAHSKTLAEHSLARIKGKEESAFRRVGVTVEIPTGHQPSTGQKFYRLSHFTRLLLLLSLLLLLLL